MRQESVMKVVDKEMLGEAEMAILTDRETITLKFDDALVVGAAFGGKGYSWGYFRNLPGAFGRRVTEPLDEAGHATLSFAPDRQVFEFLRPRPATTVHSSYQDESLTY